MSSKNDGAIVRSLEDKSTKFISSRVHNFSHLESIEVFTVKDNVNLTEIFSAMEKSGDKAPDTKDAGTLKKYFEKVFPDLDFERVYSSDLKKMVKWFSVLKENEVEIKLSVPAESDEPSGEESAEEVAVAAPKSRVAEPKTAKKEQAKEEEDVKEKEPEKPKKSAARKTSASKEAKPAKETTKPVAKKTAKKAAPKKKSDK